MIGRLNLLQKTMLEWDALRAYNAVHVARIPGPLDLPRLRQVIAGMVQARGLTGLTLDREGGTFEYGGGPDTSSITVLEGTAGWSADFDRELERQLNTPFPRVAAFSPFRFLVFPEADAFSLGLVYFHAVADAECVMRLLKDIVEAWRSPARPPALAPAERYLAPWDSLARIRKSVVARKLASFPALIRATRKASRPRYRDAADFSNGFVHFMLNPEQLLQSARSWGVTLNDVFLALLMLAITPLAPNRLGAKRRKDLALGCIVNIRKDLALTGTQAFGLFLGSFVVQHGVPAGTRLADLAREIGLQTAHIKRHRLYMGAVVEMGFARFMRRFFSRERQQKLYHKHYPLWGGLSNMDLNPLWPQPGGMPRVDYLRGVSTGPVTPLVLSFTTMGPVTNVGLSYRTTVYTVAEIESIRDCFLNPEIVERL